MRILTTSTLLFCALVLGAASTDVAARPAGKHASGWILVRLKTVLDRREPSGRLELFTGRPALDAAIVERGVARIEPALPRAIAARRAPERMRRYGLDRIYRFHVAPGTDLSGLIERLAALDDVEYAEPDYIGRISGTAVPDDSRFGDQYGFDQFSDADVDAPEAWNISTGSNGVIAILDTGVDSDHEDLAGKLVPGFDFVNLDNDPEDDNGHGTNVASIAAALTDNATGVAGACWNCLIMPMKVNDATGSGFYSKWADAMVTATNNGVRVINLSAGGNSPSSTLLDGVRYAYDAGVVVVSVTRNDNSNFVSYPGAYPETIAVGATDELDRRADPFCYSATSGSNFGSQIDVVAPGELIIGAAMGGGYNYWCGTSQAAPLVAGLVALVRDVHPSVGREEIRHLIRSGADDQVGTALEDVAGFDVYHGWGRVNMARTLDGAAASPTLLVEGINATRPHLATSNPLAVSYDFVRGDLSALVESDSGVDLGTVVCLEAASVDADTQGNEDTSTPPPGEGVFYVSRINSSAGQGSYGGSSHNRDRTPSAADCASCGNGVCEPSGGEDCLSCPADCNGLQGGDPQDQFCCGDGDGTMPVGCADARCTEPGYACSS